MSEWGNLARVNAWLRIRKYIAYAGETRGTETSKYPQEEKTKVIAQVVASERAGAQTGPVTAGPGLKDRQQTETRCLAELPGKAGRRG